MLLIMIKSPKKEKVEFKIDEAGVFISLTTLPFGDEARFYEYLNKIFVSKKIISIVKI